jgi:hypothetical protein
MHETSHANWNVKANLSSIETWKKLCNRPVRHFLYRMLFQFVQVLRADFQVIIRYVLTMNPSPVYWLQPIIGGVDHKSAQINDAPTMAAVRRLVLRRLITRYRSMAMQVKQLIVFRPAMPVV